tara:strand:+ start:60 stop:575 length:516 start_codon:yes stop_codon:yes gene_type:complete
MTIFFGDGTSVSTAPGGGLFSSVAIFQYRRGGTTSEGTFSSGHHRTRFLNHELSDPDNIASVSNNQITLGAGTYTVSWSAPAYKVSAHTTRWKNVTDGTDIAEGTTHYNHRVHDASSSLSYGWCTFTISGSKAFELRHRGEDTKNDNGFGVNPANTGSFGIGAQVTIFKHA